MPSQFKSNIIRDSSEILSWAVLGRLVVQFSLDGDLPEKRLDELIRDVQTGEVKYVLATSIGRYRLTSLQRKKAQEGFGQPDKIATIVDDVVTRGIITAFSWLGLNIKSFSWPNVKDACTYVAPPGISPEDVFDCLNHVRQQHFRVLGQVDKTPLTAARSREPAAVPRGLRRPGASRGARARRRIGGGRATFTS